MTNMPRIRKASTQAPKPVQTFTPGELFIPVHHTIPPPFEHQIESAKFILEAERVLDFSDAGTGKTRSHLIAWATRRKQGGGKALVLAPKSILYSAWANDLEKFYSNMFISSVAEAHNRKRAFHPQADIYITNLDAVKWFVSQPRSWIDSLGIDTLIVDECDAFKHRYSPTSQRSKAAARASVMFPYYAGLSGTPRNRSVTEYWHQVYLADFGHALGTEFYRFRSEMCVPVQNGPSARMITWEDKNGAEELIASKIKLFTLRYKLEDCIDIPPNNVFTMDYHLPPKVFRQYEKLKRESVVLIEKAKKQGKVISAVNKAVLASKLMQFASGASYGEQADDYVLIDTGRYEMILDLVEQRSWPVIVFFLWRHQKDELTKLADKRKLTNEYIDGSVPLRKRTEIVNAFQAGDIKVLFLQPQSAAHGLTLTTGKTTIWASPPYAPNIFTQGGRRIHRAGQTDRTETILICAHDTRDKEVYDILRHRKDKADIFMEMLT